MYDISDIVETIPVEDIDFIFISYDEPDCEHNWAETLRRIPWAQRVHGVKGFDAAHKAAAALARTPRLITIDGDSIPDREILNQTLRIRAGIRDHVFSWRAFNRLNGLCYGNGSLKCWPRQAMLEMNTHEQTQIETGAVDFCWTVPYTHMRGCYSSFDSASSPYQAFRSGFREGVKMTLNHGQPVAPERFRHDLWEGSIRRLQVWSGIGSDYQNGLWAIYGARSGLALMCEYPNPDFQKIADYEWFMERFLEAVHTIGAYVGSNPHDEIPYDGSIMVLELLNLGHRITKATGIELFLLEPIESRLIKPMIEQPTRGYDAMLEE